MEEEFLTKARITQQRLHHGRSTPASMTTHESCNPGPLCMICRNLRSPLDGFTSSRQPSWSEPHLLADVYGLLLEPRGGAHSNCLGVNFPKHMTFIYFLSLMNLPWPHLDETFQVGGNCYPTNNHCYDFGSNP